MLDTEAGTTVNEAVFEVEPKVAVIVTLWGVETPFVEIVNGTEVAWLESETVAGTEAAAGALV